MIEKIVGLAENLTPFALIGAGGIGKTAIALTVLHHDRIKKRFGSNRRFIRCDQFPASGAHFLARLSKVIGAGVENPEDLAPLRPSLSSKDMLIILDNAESILDPQGTDGRGIYTMVKELSHFNNICLGITSRLSAVPPHCKRLEIPTLSMEAARDIFYSIYDDDDHPETINNLLERLEFHALSITLLATTASDNMWSLNRLIKKWDAQRAQVLRTDHNESLAATIELSLDSPTFRKLGPNARDLLGVVAFFPRGVDEENLEWLFSTVDDPETIFDKFCILSLTYRSNGFITMLAPIRDYFSPREPRSSSLLCTTKDHYLARLSVLPDPKKPKLGGDSPWIVLEDMNVEHLLDIFTSIDASALNVWDACVHFMDHLYWEKPRQTMLRLKIEALPDSHPSKAAGLFGLSRLFGSIGNLVEQKRLLVHTLTLERARGGDFRVALTLKWLSDVNMFLGLYEEGIPQVEEALETFKRLGDTQEQATCLDKLAWLLLRDKQLDAAEDAVLRRMDLLPETGEELQACQSHRLLGVVYYTKEDYEKAIPRLETALTIASASNWQTELFWTRYEMAILFRNKREFDRASTHIEQAKSHAGNDAFNLGCGTEMQAWIWYEQGRLEDAKSEALGALEIYEKLGAAKNIKRSRGLVRQIEETETGKPGSGGEFSGCSAASLLTLSHLRASHPNVKLFSVMNPGPSVLASLELFYIIIADVLGKSFYSLMIYGVSFFACPISTLLSCVLNSRRGDMSEQFSLRLYFSLRSRISSLVNGEMPSSSTPFWHHTHTFEAASPGLSQAVSYSLCG